MTALVQRLKYGDRKVPVLALQLQFSFQVSSSSGRLMGASPA
jgi:hypothetical protein